MPANASGLNLTSLTNALPAIAPNNSSCRMPSVAKAHAVFAKSCGLNSSSLTNALPAIAPNNSSSRSPSVAEAHAVFANSCGLNFRGDAAFTPRSRAAPGHASVPERSRDHADALRCPPEDPPRRRQNEAGGPRQEPDQAPDRREEVP